MDNLLRLPEGAAYTARQGRLSAALSRQGNDIRLEAASDSTGLQVETTEHTAMTTTASSADSLQRQSSSIETTLKRRCNTLSTTLLSAICGALAILSAILIYKLKKKQ